MSYSSHPSHKSPKKNRLPGKARRAIANRPYNTFFSSQGTAVRAGFRRFKTRLPGKVARLASPPLQDILFL